MTEYELIAPHYDMLPGQRMFLVKKNSDQEWVMVMEDTPYSDSWRLVPGSKLKEVE